MQVKQGDLFWLDFDEPEGSAAGFRRPVVVVQNDMHNENRIRTTVVCSLTSSLHRAQDCANILLEVGEGNLSRQSVVVATQLDTIDKDELTEFTGRLRPARVREIIAQTQSVLEPEDADEKEG